MVHILVTDVSSFHYRNIVENEEGKHNILSFVRSKQVYQVQLNVFEGHNFSHNKFVPFVGAVSYAVKHKISVEQQEWIFAYLQ